MAKIEIEANLKMVGVREAAEKAKSDVAASMSGSGLASSVKGLPPTSFDREMRASRAKAERSRQEERDELRGRMQAAAELDYEKKQAAREKAQRKQQASEDALKSRAEKILQEQMGVIPPRLKPPKPPGGVGTPPVMSALSASGIPVISSLARAIFSPWAAAAAAAGVAMLQLRKAVMATMDAFENSRRLYARQLQSGGMPGQFVAMRGSLAKIIGVSEQEVYQYGRAVAYLSDRLSNANRIQVQVNRNLTSTAWEIDVLKENSKALFAVIANEAAPAMRNLAAGISEVTKSATSWLESPAGKKAMAGATSTAMAVAGIFGTIANVLMLKGAITKPSEASPVEAWSKRMPSSAWERMGMVIGIGSSGNPAQETARNTKRTAELLHQLVRGVPRHGGSMEISLMPQP